MSKKYQYFLKFDGIFRDFWSTFGHIYSFLQGIRIRGRKIQIFRPGRGKTRKTNVKPIFSIFIVFNLIFLKFERRVTFLAKNLLKQRQVQSKRTGMIIQ